MSLQELINQVRDNADRLYNERIKKTDTKDEKQEQTKKKGKKKNG
jgi:hypothetical protein